MNKYPDPPIMILKHKETGETQRIEFKIGYGFANKIRKMTSSWDLIAVEGNPDNATVKFMRKQISRYNENPETYNVEIKDVLNTTSKETGKSVKEVKEKIDKVSKSYSAKLLRKMKKWRKKDE